MNQETTGQPLVSLIIPIRNEAQNIKQCLAAIIRQDYPNSRLEIIVIDAASTDGSDQMVRDFAAVHPGLSIRLLQKNRHTIPAGLNMGIQAACGEIVIRVDARTKIAPDYVSTCVRYLLQRKADNVGGLMRPVGINYISNAYALAAMSPFSAGDAKFHYSQHEQYVDTVYLGAFWRKTFTEIGLYEESHCSEDFELNYRLRRAGGKILLSPTIKSTYSPRSSLTSLWRQYFTYGRARIGTLKIHPASLRWRQTIAPLFILILVTSFLFSFFTPIIFLLFIFLVSSYLLANLVASTIAAMRGGGQYLPVLPVIFATIHFAWGLGFWYELFKLLFTIKK